MRRGRWYGWEIDIVRDHPELMPRELAELLPGRTVDACAQARFRLDGRKPPKVGEFLVKDPGEYIELLSSFLVEDFECMGIWMKWNGYASFRVLEMDTRGFVHCLCTAK